MKQATLNEIFAFVLSSKAFMCYPESNITNVSNNSFVLQLPELKLTFKFRSVKGSWLKVFTICVMDNHLYEGVLYNSNYLGGDHDAYNDNFLENVRQRLLYLGDETKPEHDSFRSSFHISRRDIVSKGVRWGTYHRESRNNAGGSTN